MTKVRFFGLDSSLTEASAPFTVAGFVLFLVTCVGDVCRGRLD